MVLSCSEPDGCNDNLDFYVKLGERDVEVREIILVATSWKVFGKAVHVWHG